MAKLLAVRFWVQAGDDQWLITHHTEHQPEPDLIAASRKKASERVRRHRRRQAGLDD